MVSRVILVGVVLVTSAPAWAQQNVPAASAAAQGTDPRRTPVMYFESNLRTAVELSGQMLAQRALEVAPVRIVQMSPPVVHGIPIDGFGFHFDVQIPDILASAVAMLEMAQNGGFVVPGVSRATRPVSVAPSDRTAATAVVEPDPMTKPQSNVFDVRAMYRAFVKQSLVDAMIDAAGVLNLGTDDRLVVSAVSEDASSRRLILTIRGADLNDLRTGKITREQAKLLVREQAF